MDTLVQFSNWLQTTKLSWAASGGVVWLWPLCETLHFIGMAMLFGCIGTLDARLLGMGKGLSVRTLNALVPYGIAGFILNLLTGAVFYVGNPGQYMHNFAFGMKMLFILLAGVNVGAFYLFGINRMVDRLGPDDDAPLIAKVVAATSLFVWVGVMYWGRMLPFLGDAF
jgi:hypothetical protein